MHTRLTSVSSSADSACPARPDLEAPHALTASSPAAALTSADRSAFFNATAVDPAVFDAVPDRRGTASLKWDSAVKRGRPEDVLPLWVADMDHATAPAVTSALLWRTRHGIFGYSEPDDAYNAALTGWVSPRHGRRRSKLVPLWPRRRERRTACACATVMTTSPLVGSTPLRM